MSHELALAAPPEATVPPRERPVAIDDLFGWFTPGTNRRGVVLCATHGSEQLAAYRSWRDLAAAIAATGCATLRFDYPGEGDSGDVGLAGPTDWVGSIHRAIRYLRDETGADEIVLVGLRLGGTLAALAARETGVDRLILLAPFLSGRAYLREMTMRSRTIDQLPDGTPVPQEPGAPTFSGFRFAPELVAQLQAIDLTTPQPRLAGDVLLLGSDLAGLAGRYEAAGSVVTTAPFPGLRQLVSNVLFTETPHETFATVAAFAAEGARPRSSPFAPLHFTPTHPSSPRPSVRIDGATWSEEPVEARNGMFGILCRPRTPMEGRAAVLFVNSGSNVRQGYGRQTTRLARRLSASGITSLRMDLLGIGDSPERPGGGATLFSLEAVDDVRAALDCLESATGGPVAVIGTCSGGYLAFHTACRDERIKAAILINLYCFDWNVTDDVATVMRNQFRSTATYAGLLRKGTAWRRLLRGEVRIVAIARALARKGMDRARRQAVRLLRPGSAGETVAQRVARIRRRGGSLHLIFSAGDGGLADVATQLGRSQKAIARRLGHPPTIFDGADHNMSTAATQKRLGDLIEEIVQKV